MVDEIGSKIKNLRVEDKKRRRVFGPPSIDFLN